MEAERRLIDMIQSNALGRGEENADDQRPGSAAQVKRAWIELRSAGGVIAH
jgi:hypothetical protein